ncbi:hypothetical protein VKS41_004766 [Umbelopsis sp. WA50703]
MKVFLQNVIINRQNISQVLDRLRCEFNDFQKEYVSFRKHLSRKRNKFDYDLDVTTDHTVRHDEGLVSDHSSKELISPDETDPIRTEGQLAGTATAAPDVQDEKGSGQNSFYVKSASNKNESGNGVEKKRSTLTKGSPQSQGMKEVWGLGRTGANLTYLLYACHLALKLLPQDGRPSVILITDGVMKSSLQDESIIRLFVEDDITCSIIQVGSGQKFASTVNFGFVPDDDILHYATETTGGHFMLAKDCQPIKEDVISFGASPSVPDNDDSSEVQSGSRDSYFVESHLAQQLSSKLCDLSHPVVRYHVNVDPQLPNFYHHHLIFHERLIRKRRSDSKKHQSTRSTASWSKNSKETKELHHDHRDRPEVALHRNFPWDPKSRQPEPDSRLLKYHEYALPTEFSHIVAARTRQGFVIRSINISNASRESRRNSKSEESAGITKEHIQLLMTLEWQPNVTIEYRIHASYFPTAVGALVTSTFLSESVSPSSSSPLSIPIEGKNAAMTGGIFSRTRAPKAEIYVRAHSAYAHMLQNWDVFTRRMQMLGVVTGSVAPGDARAAPIYAKLGKLRQTLIQIRELDEILRSVATFNARQLSSLSARHHNRTFANEQQFSRLHQYEIYVNNFKEFWESINKHDLRYQIRCFYDHGSVDFLISKISPYMSPKLTSNYNQDYINNVEAEINIGLEKMKSVLAAWSTFVGSDGTYVKLVHRSTTAQTPMENQRSPRYLGVQASDSPAISLTSSSAAFCEIRLWREVGCLVTLHAVYFNVDVAARQDILRDLEVLIQSANDADGVGSYVICKRPLSTLLMRDAEHLSDFDIESYKQNALMPLQQGEKFSEDHWYMPSSLWLNGQYIVRNHMRHMTWSWNTSNQHDGYHREHKMMPLADLAFQFLCHARRNQGYQLVLPRPDRTHFYKEHVTGSTNKQACAIQYFIWKDASSGAITTELWMEPADTPSLEDQYSYVKDDTFEFDRTCLSQLVTFDQIHAVGRHIGVAEILEEKVDKTEDENLAEGTPLKTMSLSTIFDLAATLPLGSAMISLYSCPRFLNEKASRCSSPGSWCNSGAATPDPLFSPADDLSSSVHLDEPPALGAKARPVVRPALPVTAATPKTKLQITTLKPDTETNEQQSFSSYLKDHSVEFNKLDDANQDYVLLHSSLETSVAKEIKSEILLNHHYDSQVFWSKIKSAISTSTNDSCIESSLAFVESLGDMRCFVHILNPRSFIVILVVRLPAVIRGLLRYQDSDKEQTESRLREHYDMQLLQATVDKRLKSFKETNYVPVLMFECVRQKPLRPDSDSQQSTPLSQGNQCQMDEILHNSVELTVTRIESSEKLEDNLDIRPEVFNAQFSTSLSTPSNHSYHLVRRMDRIYAMSFVKSIYACMLQNRVVAEHDMEKLTKMLREDHIKVDITEFLNSRVLLSSHIDDSDDIEADIQHRFLSVLNYYFEPVETLQSHTNNVYYYRPPMTYLTRKRSHRRTSSTASLQAPELSTLSSYSEEPLLIRLECIYQKQADAELPEGPEPLIEQVVTISELPTNYQTLNTGTQKFDHNPHGIGSEQSPVASRDGTRAELHLVCLTLPALPDSEGTKQSADASTPTSSKEAEDRKDNTFESWRETNISDYQKTSLIESEARLSWFLKEEVMHNLLLLPEVTELTLKYIEEQLIKKNPYVDFPTSIVVPLTFVRNNATSMDVFLDELERDHSGSHRFARVGNYFYVKSECYTTQSSSQTPVSPSPQTELPDANTSTAGDGDDFCHGLGISVLTAEQHLRLENETVDSRQGSPSFWLILLPRHNEVQIYFYSKHHLNNRSDIVKGVKLKIQEIQEKVNRLVLLRELNETRMCSTYLEISNNEDEDESEPGLSDDNSDDAEGAKVDIAKLALNTPSIKEPQPLTIQIKRFQPGQFACPLIYTKKFPLHWRIPINGAFKSLSTETLRPFSVKNQIHMFVIEREGVVVYCKIYEESSSRGKYLISRIKDIRTPSTSGASPFTQGSSTSSSPAVRETTTPTTPALRGRLQTVEPVPSSEGDPTVTKAKSTENRHLVLDVYGVELPAWIENELVGMIENRLMSHVTLREMQQFLLRNPTSKLTSADVDYLLPVKVRKPTTQILRIPTLVANPVSLLELVKQSILATDSFHQMLGSEVKESVASYFHKQRLAAKDDDQLCRRESQSAPLKSIVSVPIADYCFYYNCATRSPSSSTTIEMEAGQGLAGICLMLLDSTGKPVSSVPLYDDDKLSRSDLAGLKLVLDDDLKDASVLTSDFHVMVQVWAYGQCDLEVLKKHIWRCCGQSVCHYLIRELSESADKMRRSEVLSNIERLHTMNYSQTLDKIFLTLQYGADWGSTIISSLTKHLFLPPWSIDDILAQASREIEQVTAQSVSLMVHRSSDTAFKIDLHHKLPWALHNVKHHLQQVIREADEFVIINGLVDNSIIANISTTETNDRRGSHESEASGKSWGERHSRRESGESSVLERTSKLHKDEIAIRQVLGGTANTKSDDSSLNPRRMSVSSVSHRVLVDMLQAHKRRCSGGIFKHCFIVMKLDTTRLSIFTFNWPNAVSDYVVGALHRIVISQESRAQMLSNIVHQKMGLFHHSLSFKDVLEPLYTTQNKFMPHSPRPVGNIGSSRATPPTAPGRFAEKIKAHSPKPNEPREKVVTLEALNDLVFASGASSLFFESSEQDNPKEEDKTKEKVHTAARVLQPNNVLRDVVAEPSGTTASAKSADPLLRHAQPFLETYLRQSRIRSAHEKAFKIYTKWVNRCVDLSDMKSMEIISPSDLRIIMGSSRLLHFCRTPLILAKANECSVTDKVSPNSRNDYAADGAARWQTELAETLLKEYATYLEGVGMHVISFDTQGSIDGEPLEPNRSFKCPTVYLLKVFDGGSVLCEVRVSQGFVSVTLYTLHRRYGRLSLWAYNYEGRETKRQRFKAFTEECDNFKTLIHVNSFVFDFHLRYIQRALVKLEPITTSIDLLGVIRTFERMYTTPANYSRNRIVSGYINVDVDITSENLLATAYRHANKVGSKVLHYENKPVACFVHSHDQSFTENATSAINTPYQFSLILCSLDKDDPNHSDVKLRLRYFVIITYEDADIAVNDCKPLPTRILKAHPGIGHHDPLDELLAPESGLTLGKVVKGARAKIDLIVSKVSCLVTLPVSPTVANARKKIKLVHYHRNDSTWSEMYECAQYSNPQELIATLQKFDTLNLADSEPNFAKYLQWKLPWDKILPMIGKYYSGGLRELEYKGEKHVLLFNARYMDYLMHIRWSSEINIQMVSREPRSKALEPAERQQVADIGTFIGYALWKYL